MLAVNLPSPQDILFLRGDINYTEFHLVNGKKVVSSTTLLRHQERFDGFLRVSRKHLVNPAFVKGLEHQGCYASITLINGSQLKISRRRILSVKGKFSTNL